MHINLPVLALGASLIAGTYAAPQAVSAKVHPRVLVYTATRGFRHDSIPTAIHQLNESSAAVGVDFVFSEDSGMFVDNTLTTFDGVMFVHNSEAVLDPPGVDALQRFFQSGGVYVGVHGASACLFNYTVYQQAVGALFDYHPPIQDATFLPLNKSHPAMTGIPDQWSYQEEVYYFRSDPRSVGAEVIMTVDEGSYTNNGTSTGSYPTMGQPHPIAWIIESPQSAQPLNGVSKAGRSFYTALGHLNSTWENPIFLDHVLNGLSWALDGASTRAYGVGKVGNDASSPTSPLSPSSASSASGSASGSGPGSGSSSSPASSSTSASSSPVSASPYLAGGGWGVAAASTVLCLVVAALL